MGSHSQHIVRRGGRRGGATTEPGIQFSKVKSRQRITKEEERGSSRGFFQQRRDLEENIESVK